MLIYHLNRIQIVEAGSENSLEDVSEEKFRKRRLIESELIKSTHIFEDDTKDFADEQKNNAKN